MSVWDFLRKDSASTRVITQFFGVGQPQHSTMDFRTLSEEGFQRNVYIFRAIVLIAQSFARMPIFLEDSTGRRVDGNTEFETLWQNPNPSQNLKEFLEAYAAWLLITGNSYVEMLGPSSRVTPPKELWLLRPDRVTITSGGSRMVASYRYRISTVTKTYKPWQIGHTKMFSSTDDWYGMSPIAVAARAIDQQNAANDWNTALYQNSARPSGVLQAEGILNDVQFFRLRKMIDEEYTGAANSGRPMLLEGGLKWLQTALNPQDLNWLSGKRENAKEIAIAIGVPPEMLGDSANKNYSNYQEARKSFYEETVLPFTDKTLGAFNRFLLPMFAGGLRLNYDRSEVEALQEDLMRIANRNMALVDRGIIDRNEARIELGFAPRKEEGMDVLTVAPGVQPIGNIMSQPETPENAAAIGSPNGSSNGQVPSGQESVNQTLASGDKSDVILIGSDGAYQIIRDELPTLTGQSDASQGQYKHVSHDQSTHGRGGTRAATAKKAKVGTGGAAVAEIITDNQEGFSVDPVTGSAPTSGFMVSKKEPTLIFDDVESIDADAIQDFEEKLEDQDFDWIIWTVTDNPSDEETPEYKHLDMFADADTYLGGWVDGDTGKVYIDVSVNVPSKEAALKMGAENDQLAIFDLDTFTVYDVKTGKPYDEKSISGDRENQTAHDQGTGQKGRSQKADRSGKSTQSQFQEVKQLTGAIHSLRELDNVTVKANGTIVVQE